MRRTLNKAKTKPRPTSWIAALTVACVASGCEGGREASMAGVVIRSDEAVGSGEGAYLEGKRELMAGNYGLAVRQFRAALRQQPDSPEYLNALAVSYEHLGRPDVAQGYFTQALAIDPNSVQTLNNVGRSLIARGASARAGAYLERAVILDPSNSVVRSNIEKLTDEIRSKSTQRAAAGAPEEQAATSWVERTDPYVQTLVTQRESAWTEGALLTQVAVTPTAPVILQAALPPPPKPSAQESTAATAQRPAIDIAIANGNGRTRMAARVGLYLQKKGWAASRLLNADHFRYAKTVVLYKPGLRTQASDLAAALPLDADLEESGDIATDVLIRIGRDIVRFDGRISSYANFQKGTP